MKFVKYNSLENHYRDKFIQKVFDEGYGKETFVCLEKCHGANFSFYFNGLEHKTAKRSGFCDGNFFSSYKLDKYKPNIEILYKRLIDDLVLEEGDTLIVYGEIFGGNFFGEKDPSAKLIQKGMNYHPDNEFVAFDIAVEYSTGGGIWMEYLEMKSYLEDTNIPVVPELFVGNIADCLLLNNEFNTKIPELFGLQVDEDSDNISEGFVIRPLNGEIILDNGSRVIIKSKNDKFSEKSGGKHETKTLGVDNLPDSLKHLLKNSSEYINENRLQAVQSKIGEPNWKQIGMVAGHLVQDVLEDFDKDNYTKPDDNRTLKGIVKDYDGKDYWKPFNRALTNLALDVIREYYKKVI